MLRESLLFLIFICMLDEIAQKEVLNELREKTRLIRRGFWQTDQSQMKIIVNDLFTNYLSTFKKEKKLFYQIYLEFFETLNYYGQHYQSLETFENLLARYETQEIKDNIICKFPVRYKLVSSVSLLMSYNIQLQSATDSEKKTKEFVEPVLKAKERLSKLYSQYLTNKKTMNQGQLERCLESLGNCYGVLSRWFEALYYINLAMGLDTNNENPNVHMLRASILERVQSSTCGNYNGQLQLDIIDSTIVPRKTVYYPEAVKEEYRILNRQKRTELKQSKISIKDLRNHRSKSIKESKNYNEYLSFCLENELFLTEHSMYCKCERSTYDDLTIRSSHEHTQIDFIKPYEECLQPLVFDFILARKKHFDSLPGNMLRNYFSRSIKRDDNLRNIKLSLLKDSFRLCYSILDTIAVSILEALDIDYPKILKAKKKSTNIHFVGIWEDLITSKHFDDNFYVQTLYSIAYDIMEKTSGHKEFRDIRNALEHKIFRVKKKNGQMDKLPFKKLSYYEIGEQEFYEKSLVLLVYTKSLLLTYTYFLRRVSISKAPKEMINPQDV